MRRTYYIDKHPDRYDIVLWPMERVWFAKWRKRLLKRCSGSVLEIGSGTGVNLQYYPDPVRCVTAVDPSHMMITRLRKKAEINGWGDPEGKCLKTDIAHGEDLPFPDGEFDCAVITLILCSVEDPEKVIDETIRTLKPGGSIIMMEHQLPVKPIQGAIFRGIAPIWHLPSGCNLDRKTQRMIGDMEDLRIIEEERRGPVLGYPFYLAVIEKSEV